MSRCATSFVVVLALFSSGDGSDETASPISNLRVSKFARRMHKNINWFGWTKWDLWKAVPLSEYPAIKILLGKLREDPFFDNEDPDDPDDRLKIDEVLKAEYKGTDRFTMYVVKFKANGNQADCLGLYKVKNGTTPKAFERLDCVDSAELIPTTTTTATTTKPMTTVIISKERLRSTVKSLGTTSIPTTIVPTTTEPATPERSSSTKESMTTTTTTTESTTTKSTTAKPTTPERLPSTAKSMVTTTISTTPKPTTRKPTTQERQSSTLKSMGTTPTTTTPTTTATITTAAATTTTTITTTTTTTTTAPTNSTTPISKRSLKTTASGTPAKAQLPWFQEFYIP